MIAVQPIRTQPDSPEGPHVIRDDRFLISHKAYAIDLTSLTITEPGGHGFTWAQVDAVWFRRRRGVTVACVGTLRDLQASTPQGAHEFLAAHDDGRYGGNCQGRWDGTGYWGAEQPETVAEHLALLQPMLAAYPAIPDGYDGWWRFQ